MRNKAAPNEERDKLAEEMAGMRADIKALGEEHASTEERNKLRREVADLNIERGRLIEDNDRKIRDTEHKTGLLRDKQAQDAEHQKREIEQARKEAVLEVREQNLDHSKGEFDQRMEFREEQFAKQQEQWDRHLADFRNMFGDAMKRLPNIDVALTGAIGRPVPAEDDDEKPVRRTSRSRKDDD